MRSGAFLVYICRDAVTSQVVGRGHTARTRSDDRHFFIALQSAWGHFADVGVLCLVRGLLLDVAHMDGFIVVKACAVLTARLCAKDACNGRTRVVNGDDTHGFSVLAPGDQGVVFRDLLLDGTATVFTGCLVAVVKGQLRFGLPGGDFFAPAFLHARVRQHLIGQLIEFFKIDLSGISKHIFRFTCHLVEAHIAARFQQGGCHGHWTDTYFKDVFQVKSVCASRK